LSCPTLSRIGWAAAGQGERIVIAIDASLCRHRRGSAILEALTAAEADELVPAISFYSAA
jgi:hypothetical protein